jgi:hypothetical protein
MRPNHGGPHKKKKKKKNSIETEVADFQYFDKITEKVSHRILQKLGTHHRC